jgi:membrane fusion protein, multidrug efflux system
MPDTPLPQGTRPTTTLERPRQRRRRWPWLLLVLLLLAGGAAWWYFAHHQPQEQEAGQRGPGRGRSGSVPVTVAPATRHDIPITFDALGTVQPIATITVRAQVDGQLVQVAFTEGQDVNKGDLLAQIDPRTYKAALDQAVAKKAQDEALLANARLDLQRYTELSRIAGASRQQLDTQRALVGQYEAMVQADQAAIDSARTQLDFTTIRAPVDGRVGLRQVDQGNLVHASDANGIVVVTQMKPITVTFTLPQQRLQAVLDAMAAGPVPVQVIENDGKSRATGTLLTIDNQVDQTTGTIKLRAQFANGDERLWPGAFVNVRMQVATVKNVLAIPLVGVLRGPDGPYAFVLKDDNTVQQRPLTLGVMTANLAVVTQGLEDGERVVTSGALRLNPGAQVTLLERPAGNAAAPAAGAAPASPAPANPAPANPASAGASTAGNVPVGDPSQGGERRPRRPDGAQDGQHGRRPAGGTP